MIAFSVLLLLMQMAAPPRVAVLAAHDDRRALAPAVEWLEDSSDSLTPDDVTRPEVQRTFQPWAKRSAVNFGPSNSTYWLRVTVRRETATPAHWVLVMEGRPLKAFDVFLGAPDGRSWSPISRLPAYTRQPVFALPADTVPHTLYIRVRSSHAVTVPIAIWQEAPFASSSQARFLLQAMYYGGALALILFYLLLFISLRDQRYLSQVAVGTAVAVGIFLQNGMGSSLLWPFNPNWDVAGAALMYAFAGAAGTRFARQCLPLQTIAPRHDRALQLLSRGYMGLSLLVIPAASDLLDLRLVSALFLAMVIFGGILVPWSAVLAWRARVRGSGYFIVAFSTLWACALVGGLRTFGLLPSTTFTIYALQFGAGFEMIILAMALTDIVRAEREQREASLSAALATQQQLVGQLSASEERLVRTVSERTADLEKAVEKESATLQQYLRFGALITHEFRNPLGVILSQVSMLRRTHAGGSTELSQRLDVVHGATRRLSALFDAWMEGDNTQRSGLRFMPERLPANGWLQARVAEHEHLAGAHLFTVHVAEEVRYLVADPHLLDLALSNLLVNAFKYSSIGGTVAVHATVRDADVCITVTDDGPAIPAALHERIFEPYVRGTHESSIPGLGLGLATVRNAMEAHGGRVTLHTPASGGNVFSLWLPVPPSFNTPVSNATIDD